MNAAKKKERCLRTRKIIHTLKQMFPNAGIALRYSNNWELLVAVVLSAQCTDRKVNEVTTSLFKKYRTLEDYSNTGAGEFEQDIKPTGFYRNKAKNILAAAAVLKRRFGGRIPQTMEEMLTIPGIARKSANVILGNAYGVVEGIAVDTHVRRFAIKFDLTDHQDPVRIERDLMELVPRSEWFHLTYRLIEYGRSICPARKHGCTDHPLTRIYPKAAEIWPLARSGMIR